jgi:predicted GNAT family N-acyltransferase
MSSRIASAVISIFPTPSCIESVFSCGVPALDRYLQTQAGQDVSKHVAAAFVITPNGETIAGFYTLSAHIVNLGDLPEEAAKKLPRYPNVPATRLGRLAVSLDFRGSGIGELLLVDAFKRVLASTREVASTVVVVDAKDERAREFYLRHDFIPLPSQPNRLFIRLKPLRSSSSPNRRAEEIDSPISRALAERPQSRRRK